MGNAKDKENGVFVEYKRFEDVPDNITSIKKTMFPNDPVAGLENTIRILPSDQNTGGFYIALFRKKHELPVELSFVENPEIDEVIEKPKKKRKILDRVQPLYVPIENNPDCENLIETYGLKSLPISQLLTPLTKQSKNLFYVSTEVNEFINREDTKALKVLNVGVCAFSKNKHNPTKNISVYRPHQDALPFISKFVTKNRICSDRLDLLQKLLKDGNFETEDFLEIGLGYFVLKFNQIDEEVLVLKVSPDKFQTVVPREHIDSLLIRYPILK